MGHLPSCGLRDRVTGAGYVWGLGSLMSFRKCLRTMVVPPNSLQRRRALLRRAGRVWCLCQLTSVCRAGNSFWAASVFARPPSQSLQHKPCPPTIIARTAGALA